MRKSIGGNSVISEMQLTTLLFEIPSPAKWSTEQVANIIAVISAIATVGALWYAIAQGIWNSKKINDLAEIAKKLSEANDLQRQQNEMSLQQHGLQQKKLKSEARPNFSKAFISPEEPDQMQLYITNEGNRAIIERVIDQEREDSQVSLAFYFGVVDKGQSYSITLKSKDKPISECSYTLSVGYTDVYGNPYMTVIYGTGANIHLFNSFDDDSIPLSTMMAREKAKKKV